jgi:hypothetical protein
MVKASVIGTDKKSLLSTRVMLTLRHAIERKLQAKLKVAGSNPASPAIYGRVAKLEKAAV